MGLDPSDNGTSWDTDGDGALDGVECTLGHNPRNAADRPSTADCGGTGDSDGDTRGDCVEAADVNGNGVVDFVEDTMYYARAVLLPRASFGKTMDFDLDKNGVADFGGDAIQEAKFAFKILPCQ